MSQISAGKDIAALDRPSVSSADGAEQAKDRLTQAAAWISERNIAFRFTSAGMIIMLLWAGAFKFTAPGAEGIAPLLTHSPLTMLQFKLLGPYVMGDLIGLTEWIAATLYLAGYRWPKTGIVAGFITLVMFFTTSSMLITTPGDTIVVHGFHYMNLLGLFLYKDVIAFGASFYLIGSYGKRATAGKR
jgi:reactive chlorine resistance protein C